MARTIRFEMIYEAPVETVAAMLGDPAFREEVCRSQGATEVDVSVVPPDSAAKEVRIDYWMPTAGVPSFARKIVGDTTNVVQEERWSSATLGDVVVKIPGKPAEIRGTSALTETGTGTLQIVEMTAKVKIPLVGGKLEGLVADLLLKALKSEFKIGRDYLRR